jgi:hypothetical protein
MTMPVTLSRPSPSTRTIQGAMGILSTSLRALSGTVDVTETISSQINLDTPDAYNKLVALHKSEIDAFRERCNDLETAIAATAAADTDIDNYLVAQNP